MLAIQGKHGSLYLGAMPVLVVAVVSRAPKTTFPILRPFVVVADSGYGLHDCLTSKSSSVAAPQQLTLNHAGKQKL